MPENHERGIGARWSIGSDADEIPIYWSGNGQIQRLTRPGAQAGFARR